jgi:hypothetical protein
MFSAVDGSCQEKTQFMQEDMDPNLLEQLTAKSAFG